MILKYTKASLICAIPATIILITIIVADLQPIFIIFGIIPMTFAMAFHAKSKGRNWKWCGLILLSVIGMVGILFLADLTKDESDEHFIVKVSRFLNNTILSKVCFLGGICALFASCGYIAYEHDNGYKGPDSLRGLDYPVMTALIVTYGIFVFLPSLRAHMMTKKNEALIAYATASNGVLFALTCVGFLSLVK